MSTTTSASSLIHSTLSSITSSLHSTASSTPLHSSSPTAAPSSSPSSGAGTSQSGPQSSPLLFFVALGFGVVFTNLWIIVGVKYCFRYSARNRPPRDENGDPIDLAAMPRQRRRREKKLMSMEEVNERFPITKYKAWTARRAEQGLSTAGGVDPSASRPGSVKDAAGTVGEIASNLEPTVRPSTAASTHKDEDAPAPTAPTDPAPAPTDTAPAPNPITEPTTAEGEVLPRVDDAEEDDPIQMAVPAEMMAAPGDSCAICIDTLEEDDDVRGLTCGHAFHASCVDPWLTSRRACCPLCKADYYVPKPRPEGEMADLERLRSGGSRPDLPPATTFSILNGRMRARHTHAYPRHAAPRFTLFSRRRAQDEAVAMESPLPAPPPEVEMEPERRRERTRPPFPAVHLPRMPWRRGTNAEETTAPSETTPRQMEEGGA